MKVVMLDVDGVLAHSETVGLSRGQERMWRYLAQLDSECMDRLAGVLKRTGAKVVVSSTWRIERHGMNALGKALRQRGLRRTVIVGQTGRGKTRTAEIQAWLAEHPEVTIYAVIDDEPMPDLVGVYVAGGYYNGGMQDEHAAELERLLLQEGLCIRCLRAPATVELPSLHEPPSGALLLCASCNEPAA